MNPGSAALYDGLKPLGSSIITQLAGSLDELAEHMATEATGAAAYL